MSRRDLDFLLYEWLDTAQLFERGRFADHSRETVDATLDLAERIATDRFAPHNRVADLNEPQFDGTTVTMTPEVAPALRAFCDAGFIAAPLDEAMGGSQLPLSVFSACMTWFGAANAGTTAYAGLTMSAAKLIATYGTNEQVEQFVGPMVEGRWFGTMALSEPHAGSNLADIVTRAEPQPDGTYRVFGRKMWISCGDHELTDNIVHLVLARIPGGPSGTRGISLFIVPKVLPGADGEKGERNDVALAGINHKMGYRGAVNTAPVFGDGAFTPRGRAGAVGYLLGEPHRGLRAMFTMMNEFRVAVGLGATSLGYTGYLTSLAYARERLQGRPLGASADAPQVAIVDFPDVRRMLLAQKAYVEGALALGLYCSRLVDDIKSLDPVGDAISLEESTRLLGLLTPIVKSWPSQWCLEANSLAIQVLGGAGYTRDHDLEQHYRDNRLNAIHEGTHGIQGLDLLGRKVLLDGGAGLALLFDRMRATAARADDTGAEGAGLASQLVTAADRFPDLAPTLMSMAADPTAMLAESTAFLEALGHVVIAWVWLEQWVTAHGKTGTFYDGKRAATRYFFTRELPRVDVWLDVVARADRLTVDLDPACL